MVNKSFKQLCFKDNVLIAYAEIVGKDTFVENILRMGYPDQVSAATTLKNHSKIKFDSKNNKQLKDYLSNFDEFNSLSRIPNSNTNKRVFGAAYDALIK